jgi:N6-L-threonylcarbamoyladenine synthase
MKILAIETSCDETAVAIIEAKSKGSGLKQKIEFQILGNDLASQISLHAQYGGVFPMMAKREHAKNIIPIMTKVLKEAKFYEINKKIKENKKLNKKIEKLLDKEQELHSIWIDKLPNIKKPKIDAIAVTTGPGLEPALWVGINFAQALGAFWNLPVIAVNHMEGHIFSIFPDKSNKFIVHKNKDMFPMLSLLVSGGHTELVVASDWMKYKKIGETRDDAAGEAFDKVARMMDLPYPGGPEISRLAKTERDAGNSNAETFAKFPRPMIYSKDFDFSFSGLKTAVLYTIRDMKKENPEILESSSIKQKIAKEFEDSVVEVLTTKTLKAIDKYKVKTLCVGGGVSANRYLQEKLKEKIKELNRGINVIFPKKGMSTDNALMIAIAGYFQYQKKKPSKNIGKLKAQGNLSL